MREDLVRHDTYKKCVRNWACLGWSVWIHTQLPMLFGHTAMVLLQHSPWHLQVHILCWFIPVLSVLGGVGVARGWQCQTFVAERRQSLAIPGASSAPQCASSSCLGKHHPRGGGPRLRGPASQNPAAWGYSALTPSGMMCTSKSLQHKQRLGPSSLQDISSSRLSIRWVNFSCHRGILHPNPSWKSLHLCPQSQSEPASFPQQRMQLL